LLNNLLKIVFLMFDGVNATKPLFLAIQYLQEN
jgi:hypothetical protein